MSLLRVKNDIVRYLGIKIYIKKKLYLHNKSFIRKNFETEGGTCL